MSSSRKVSNGLKWGAERQLSSSLQQVLSRATRSWMVGFFS